MCSDVISGGQGQMKYGIRSGKIHVDTSEKLFTLWSNRRRKNYNMIWQRNKDFFMPLPQMYVFKLIIFVSDDEDAILG